ncbi:small oligopeptide transporter, OPT family [Cordyceps fumosorosea ARSEF 2679]|uniref:Small oligopeptide transporter, OPT family n=1 Tax=Cordyceps fumosorosea (strain ARSEF 2679) TaxID=1081104 RepID=A0A167WJJ9_CORFA|nr:small oligopeptide transporter, OPT family [Cordyceps fumosorosea ARSEF 2679]OAA63871.1 small oligopeptide transporter, OPT family [Cordyceps fumosorosea ARSEF 2679]
MGSRYGILEAVNKALIRNASDIGDALEIAARNGNEQVARRLPSIHPGDHPSNEPGMPGAVCHGYNALRWAVDEGNRRVAWLLLNAPHKVNLDARDEVGRSPLSYAVGFEWEWEDVAGLPEKLLESGIVNVNSRDHEGRTRLSYAMEHDNDAIADVDQQDDNGKTPLQHAMGHVRFTKDIGHLKTDMAVAIAEVLLTLGQANAAMDGDPAMINMMLSSSLVDPNVRDDCGRTPFSYLASSGNVSVIDRLLRGTVFVDLDAAGSDGRTPLSYAAQENDEAVVGLLLATRLVHANERDRHGRTPLSYAAQHNDAAVIDRLLAWGLAQADVKNQQGRTPLSYAAGRVGWDPPKQKPEKREETYLSGLAERLLREGEWARPQPDISPRMTGPDAVHMVPSVESHISAGNMKSKPISDNVAALAPATVVSAVHDDKSLIEAPSDETLKVARGASRESQQKARENEPNPSTTEKPNAVPDDAFAGDDDRKAMVAETNDAALLHEESPYEEVRAAVRNTDGGEVANTVRAWILGMLFVTLGAGLNMFLSMRSPAIAFPAIIVQLLVYPIGCFWARVVPTRKFKAPFGGGLEWTFNPGPFTIKEHTVVTLMANVTFGYAYSTDALLALQGKPFYDRNLGWGFALLFTLSSQLIGIAFAGVFRRFLVWPAAMLWPAQFSSTILMYALHDRGSGGASANGWRISRYSWFCLAAAGMFAYYWLPAVVFQGLSVFSFPTWIRPDNVVVNQLFGGYSGLSLLPITFDWTYVTAYLANPLLAPTHAHVNTLVGLVCFMLLPIVGITYTGALWSKYLPLVTSQVYDNTQKGYTVNNILGPGFTFDEESYKRYSPLFLSPALALNYGLSFAALMSTLVHTSLHHGKEIWHRFRSSRNQEPDVHLKLMKRYQEAPDWWYGALFLLSLALGLATVLAYDSQLPWWAFFVSLLLAVIFMIPSSMILAVSNIVISLNVLSAFLAGFMIPGRPIGVMMFKVFSVITLGQAQTYSSDLKLGHYMKIPPKVTFWCQVIPTIWAVFVQIAVMNWTLGNIEDACQVHQKDHFTCPNGRAFFSSSIVWGVIGPQRMFGVGSMYSHFNWFWLAGVALPVLLYLLAHKAGIRFFRHFNAPIMFGSMAWLPPATPLSFSSWAIVGLIFNKWIHNRWNGWWTTYNYITASALDAGLILSTVIIFFAITFPGVPIPQWWGNVAVQNTLDARYAAMLKTVPKNGTFGPETW